MKKLIEYDRVSTQKQGKSGLGLEGQQMAVRAYATANAGTILKSYVEVETGTVDDGERPELAKAIAHAKRAKATLVIAKLDRLSRNVAFLSALMESGVEFVACDNPCADRFTIHILACCAEKEARDISARTKAALGAYKARGGVLGSAREECRGNLSQEARAKGQQLGSAAHREAAKQAYADLVPMIRQLREEGKSYQAIADQLNSEDHTTRRGNPWNDVQVRRVLERA